MKVLNKCRNGKVDITNEDIVNKLKMQKNVMILNFYKG